MNSKERVLRALTHKKTDRLPANYTAHQEVTEKLIKHLGVADEHELLCALNVDMRRILCNINQPYIGPDSEGYITNIWGVRTKEPDGEKKGGVAIYPFNEDSTVEDINNHNWPDASKLDFSYVRELCEKYSGEYAIFGSPWCEFFHIVGRIIGQENYFVLMTTNPEVIDAITTHIVDYLEETTRRFLEVSGGMIDITYYGNDFGTQRGLFISPVHWERFIRKHLKRLIDVSHSFGCKVMLHSCGAIRELIPILIEDGVDIIDPIQVTATGMDFDGLYDDFTSRICFHGGIDMQFTLPSGTVEDVRREVRSRIATAREKGGYILSPSQQLFDLVPIDNILALYEENMK